jgi:transposase-like protein
MRLYEGKEMNEELLKGLTEEQIAKAKACKNSDELLQLAKAECVELNEEQLAAVSGGGCFSTRRCPYCNSDNVSERSTHYAPGELVCHNCGKTF